MTLTSLRRLGVINILAWTVVALAMVLGSRIAAAVESGNLLMDRQAALAQFRQRSRSDGASTSDLVLQVEAGQYVGDAVSVLLSSLPLSAGASLGQVCAPQVTVSGEAAGLLEAYFSCSLSEPDYRAFVDELVLSMPFVSIRTASLESLSDRPIGFVEIEMVLQIAWREASAT